MMSKQTQNYKTRQRQQILSFFLEHEQQHLTAQEICTGLESRGLQIGKATVYRTLNKLADEGVLRRFFSEKGQAACFEYLENETHCQNYHLKCIYCGALIHLSCERLGALQAHLLAEHGFTIDRSKTVIYGACAACAASGKASAAEDG